MRRESARYYSHDVFAFHLAALELPCHR